MGSGGSRPERAGPRPTGSGGILHYSPAKSYERAESVRVLHPAQDVIDGVQWYGLQVDDALVAITSTRQAHSADQLPEGIALRHTEPGPSTVSGELGARWLTTGESESIARTLDALADFITRYVVRRKSRIALWIAGDPLWSCIYASGLPWAR